MVGRSAPDPAVVQTDGTVFPETHHRRDSLGCSIELRPFNFPSEPNLNVTETTDTVHQTGGTDRRREHARSIRSWRDAEIATEKQISGITECVSPEASGTAA